jgi:peroxiredoxin
MAPDFALSSTFGRILSLKDCVSDNFLALIFFPDGRSARMRSILAELNKGLPETLFGFKVGVAAVSPEKIHRLNELATELGLSYPLLSDSRMTASQLYNITDSAGKGSSVHLSAFVIDDEFIVRHRFSESPENEFKIEEFRKSIARII